MVESESAQDHFIFLLFTDCCDLIVKNITDITESINESNMIKIC